VKNVQTIIFYKQYYSHWFLKGILNNYLNGNITWARKLKKILWQSRNVTNQWYSYLRFPFHLGLPIKTKGNYTCFCYIRSRDNILSMETFGRHFFSDTEKSGKRAIWFVKRDNFDIFWDPQCSLMAIGKLCISRPKRMGQTHSNLSQPRPRRISKQYGAHQSVAKIQATACFYLLYMYVECLQRTLDGHVRLWWRWHAFTALTSCDECFKFYLQNAPKSTRGVCVCVTIHILIKFCDV
jgi:hypothetical protein